MYRLRYTHDRFNYYSFQMEDKKLQDKAIQIKGKDYVLVSDRILYFNETYPDGFVQTHLISEVEDELIIMKAKVVPDIERPDRYFTAYSQAKWGDGYINKTSALENAETSAVGRALGFMGIGVIDSIASKDELTKAEQSFGYQGKPKGEIVNIGGTDYEHIVSKKVSPITGQPSEGLRNIETSEVTWKGRKPGTFEQLFDQYKDENIEPALL